MLKIKYGSNKSSRWSVESGRILCYDGRPLVYIAIATGVKNNYNIAPADADDLTEFIAFLLNEEGATPERGPITLCGRPLHDK